ncbi:hypothetical protein AAFF_G00255350 [Aldrovandia affinis]|uniref:Uncharacterized protein n=1 Tax=Aldrovandia affinis TaxID=143900 RepID=A0AAD7RC92_9TELE|nr:hypothetical protein AAFF_G00255350 [Aldrovandia affinis]
MLSKDPATVSHLLSLARTGAESGLSWEHVFPAEKLPIPLFLFLRHESGDHRGAPGISLSEMDRPCRHPLLHAPALAVPHWLTDGSQEQTAATAGPVIHSQRAGRNAPPTRLEQRRGWGSVLPSEVRGRCHVSITRPSGPRAHRRMLMFQPAGPQSGLTPRTAPANQTQPG